MDVAFDYINTYYFFDDAFNEAIKLVKNDDIVATSIHKWIVDENGIHFHSGVDGVLYSYNRNRQAV